MIVAYAAIDRIERGRIGSGLCGAGDVEAEGCSETESSSWRRVGVQAARPYAAIGWFP
ncbi:hypothetical protein LFL97_38685 (plasmid) [Burkholderia sp. JSH-S8]|nr:hypothetical protein LFL97_38685 [Burkholderia sp. JSH-S8]